MWTLPKLVFLSPEPYRILYRTEKPEKTKNSVDSFPDRGSLSEAESSVFRGHSGGKGGIPGFLSCGGGSSRTSEISNSQLSLHDAIQRVQEFDVQNSLSLGVHGDVLGVNIGGHLH